MSFGYAPKGWATCDGQLLPINQNQALFALLGTTYGGNGQTTFALPDLRGRTPIHEGSGRNLGEEAGEQAHTLTQAETPTHAHVMNGTTAQADANSNGAAPTRMVAQSNFSMLYGAPASLVAMNPQALSNVGGSQPHQNMQPYLTLSLCIALQGIFPSQN